ncbi:MAG: AcrB/AcrD/AcrF family protein [Candidatus Melainabacteria bacterium]|nr:MAG: AcrB/AcrD/AcrF family protein [Candidatus Melainabacteria bacterium]
MWIVQLALKQPHTFIVMALLIFLFGFISVKQMPVDIFPNIDEPIVSCVWTYTGMQPDDIENLLTTVTERALTSTVKDIQHMESMSLSGMSIIKIFLHQGGNIAEAVAQVASTGNAIMKQLPPNITPPLVTQSSATDVPVLQLVVGSKKLGEAELFDCANSFIRIQLAVVQGSTIPYPNGGKYRQVMIDLNPDSLAGYGLTPYDIVQAVNKQSIIAPSGTAKMGDIEYIVSLNNMPKVIDTLNDIPLKHVKGATVYLKDVAFVHDGFQPQLNIVNLNNSRAVIMSILKNGDASTLAVVNQVKGLMNQIRASVPKSVTVDILTDQSKFVVECVKEVFQEAITAASLTAILMLAILGSWRSTLIVITSIPLSIFVSIICLHITGNTINSMTLGGLALAVGMLVDDATVEIENVHRQMDMGKKIEQAILDGAQEVALPAMVSTVSICIVFLPVFLLPEPAKSLFVPLGMAVSFAMLASYGLSRTIVPLMSKALFKSEEHAAGEKKEESHSFFGKIHKFIDTNFDRLRDIYHGFLGTALDHKGVVILGFLGFYALSFCLLPLIGREFFPTIDAGQIRLHVNAPPGTRVEVTERIFRGVETQIRKIIPADEIVVMTDNIGMAVSAVNYAFSDSQTISEADGEILLTLSEERKHPTVYYQRKIREMLTRDFPQCDYYFQPADIITQILNAGLPSPIDIKIVGFNKEKNFEIAKQIKRKVENVEGAVDVCLHQVMNAPRFFFEVDRTRANQLGLNQKDISNSLLVSLSSSFQVAPNFWLNRNNGVSYNLAAQTPQYRISSIGDLFNTPVATSQSNYGQDTAQLLSNVAKPVRQFTPAVVNHYNVAPVYDVYAACQGKDLGSVSDDIQKIVDGFQKELPRGTRVVVAGQVLSMKLAFYWLLIGLAGALVLVYLLLVVNYQSWSDPLIILMAVPGALSGILWSLYVTQTNFSVPALMGTIMTIGVASANSILMVTFCNEQLREGKTAREAAHTAGHQRFRPVSMTALAMIIGMIPMASSAGQNAPIGRAVIGGLTIATFSTLFFVPLIFTHLRQNSKLNWPPKHPEQTTES